MIAKLTGLLDSVGDDWAVLDVGGVGYLVFCSTRTLSQLPGSGEAVSFVIETHVWPAPETNLRLRTPLTTGR